MILVVDDDPRIRAATVQVLVAAGYDVMSAEDGLSALAVLDAKPQISILVSDVLMPGMNGTVLAARALQARPGLGIVFMSGDVSDTPVSAFGTHILLAKPFTQATLIAAVAQCEVCR